MNVIKRTPIWGLALMLIIVSLAVYVLAQQTGPADKAGKLADAIALLNDGKPNEAQAVIASVDQSDPQYGVAQCYGALCAYELKDYLAFWQAMDTNAAVKNAVITPKLREDLAFKQIDVLFYFRRFEDILAKIEQYQTNNPTSARLDSVAEYRLAALFERGMKKTTEACTTKDETQFNRRWTEGKANLEQFLALASSFRGTNYGTIKKHILKEDVWVTRVTLGDEQAVLEEVPIKDEAGREKLGLLRIQLYQKLQPEKIDRNLERMRDFIAQFPESKSRKKVEFDMANLSFPRGKQLCMEAEEAEYARDPGAAAEKRSQAGSYFETVRSVQKEAIADKTLGIEASDILDLRADMLYSYYLEKDYDRLRQLASALISESKPGELNWMQGKVYEGVALLAQSPQKTKEAAAIFDEVLALNFKNKPDHDHQLDIAVRWRTSIALKSGDKVKAQALVEWVRDSECTKPIKSNFLKDHQELASPGNSSSK